MEARTAFRMTATSMASCTNAPVVGEKYPMAIDIAGTDPVYVGRIREDKSNPNTFNLWVVADNLRIGAALNAVRVAEIIIKEWTLTK